MSFVLLSSRIFRLFCPFLVVSAFICQAQSQSSKAEIRGKVLDPADAPIAGARITAVPNGQTSSSSTVSNQSGEFTLALEIGSYTLKITANGFQDASRTVSIKKIGSEALEIVLPVATQHDTVTVTDVLDYRVTAITTATKTAALLRDVPQSITVVTQEQIKDQQMTSIGDVIRYVPGVSVHQGENNRDQLIFRGNSTSADFFLNGVRDDVQYYRDLYNVERIEVLKGPNAMIFGRGGGGGVINRVTKEAGLTSLREISLQSGSFGNKRFSADFGQPIKDKLAFRLNGAYENSDSFRKHVVLERYAFAPTLTIAPSKQTKITLNYEYLNDRRVADRGITSFMGRPADIDIATFYGNPDDSHVRADVNLGTASIEHLAGKLTIRNRTQFGDYNRFYQNYVPRDVNAAKTQVTLTAYNNSTHRQNVFNQTDVTYAVTTGKTRHTLLGGAEFGLQLTDNFRNTGYFNNTATTFLASYDNPTINTPVTFRQSATDANNHLKATVVAAYVQDQIELSRFVQVIAGVRFDRFDLKYYNNRNGDNLRRTDNLTSPRVGILFKPLTEISLYANYSVSYLPSSGDQFSSLTTITQQVKPEKFGNYEVGVKWDISHSFSFNTAIFRLDRTNTRATDPNDPTRIIQTGSQRTNGFEIGINGNITRAWKLAGGYAYQDAFITSATTAARLDAQVGQVPHHNFSIWNNYQITSKLGAGLGIINRSDMFAAVDNTVIVPGYMRADAAVFFSITEKIRFQANVENLLDKKYYTNADSNTNISPGFPVTVRVGLTARF